MQARLFTTQSNVSSQSDRRTEADACQQQYADLIRHFSVLVETTWPSELPAGFGEEEVQTLCVRIKTLAATMLLEGAKFRPTCNQ